MKLRMDAEKLAAQFEQQGETDLFAAAVSHRLAAARADGERAVAKRYATLQIAFTDMEVDAPTRATFTMPTATLFGAGAKPRPCKLNPLNGLEDAGHDAKVAAVGRGLRAVLDPAAVRRTSRRSTASVPAGLGTSPPNPSLAGDPATYRRVYGCQLEKLSRCEASRLIDECREAERLTALYPEER